jgi:hypothetical protein
VSPVKYELGFYSSEDGVVHSDRRENSKSYTNSLSLTKTGRNGKILAEVNYSLVFDTVQTSESLVAFITKLKSLCFTACLLLSLLFGSES